MKSLVNCYFNSMKLAMDNGIRSIAFPSISTGVYSFPVELAAKIAVHTVNRFLQDNPDSFDLVEWVLFDTHTESVYEAEVDKLYEEQVMLEKRIVYKVPSDVRKQSIETLKVRKTTLEYLRQNGFKTVEDIIDKQLEIPSEYRGNIYAYLMFGIED